MVGMLKVMKILKVKFCLFNFLGKGVKEFSFKNFKLWIALYRKKHKVGDLAEKENHHPDISFGWGYCKIKIFTHAIKGLAESDFILAAKIDKI